MSQGEDRGRQYPDARSITIDEGIDLVSAGECHGRPGADRSGGRWGPETGGKRVPSMGKRPARMEISLGSLRGSRMGVGGNDPVTHGSHDKLDGRMLTVSIRGTLV